MQARPRILVSACLVGVACRYDGRDNAVTDVLQLSERYELIPVCPEQLGGLSTPRPPAERIGNEVVTRDGARVTEAFARGADQACRLARLFGVSCALLKARSPSCGAGRIYDGSFSGRLIPGNGVTVHALEGMGIKVYDETQIDQLTEEMESE